MKKIIFLCVFLVSAIGCFAQTPNQTVLLRRSSQQTDLERLVREAFAAAKPRRLNGGETRNVTLIFELPRTAEILPFLKPYLNGGDSYERSYVVSLLNKIISPESVELLLQGLADSTNSTAEEAAGILFKNYDRKVLTSLPDLKNALYKSILKGNHSVPAYLLLGYFSGEETQRILAAACLDRTKTDVNQSPELLKARRMLVACVLSSSIESKKSVLLLEEFRNNFSINQSYFFYHIYIFLLNNLELIDASDVLNILFQKMAFDTRELYPVIDGKYKGNLRNSPRFLDLAINKFVERLKINVGFKVANDKRYSQAQIIKARRLILAEINRL